jgi:hypothetical protein
MVFRPGRRIDKGIAIPSAECEVAAASLRKACLEGALLLSIIFSKSLSTQLREGLKHSEWQGTTAVSLKKASAQPLIAYSELASRVLLLVE